jgi:hypothetical protein
MLARTTALVTLVSAATAVPLAPEGELLLSTFDGASGTTQTWRSENDPVMGGVSTGSDKVEGGHLEWSGEVKIVPKLQAPGFCTVRTQATFPDISSYEGLIIKARLKAGTLTSLKISMDSSVRSSPRQGEFEGRFKFSGTNGAMQTIFVPFSSMSQSWRGQKEGGPPSAKQLAKITGLGFNQDGVAGKFDYEIVSIAAGNGAPAPSPSPSPPPSTQDVIAKFSAGKEQGARWEAVNDPVMGGQSTGHFKVQGDSGMWTGDVKIVPKLRAPGFCRLQGDIAKTDLSAFDGLLFAMKGQGAPLKTLVAVVETRGLLRSGQWTAPVAISARGEAFVEWSAFKPFTIRPEPGSAPTKAQLRDVVQVGLLADGTAGEFELQLTSVKAVGRPGPTPPTPAPSAGLDLFKFGAGAKAWRVTNDPVMGGRSKSEFTVGTDAAGHANVGLFSGDVAIVPSLRAPGFCNAFVGIPTKDASEYDAIEITLRSHGPLTAFKSSWGGKGVPKDPNCHHPGCQYQTGSSEGRDPLHRVHLRVERLHRGVHRSRSQVLRSLGLAQHLPHQDGLERDHADRDLGGGHGRRLRAGYLWGEGRQDGGDRYGRPDGSLAPHRLALPASHWISQ